MKLIGLCGYARVGKDTAAANMPGFRRLAFADALKKDLQPILNMVGCDLSDPKDKEKARDLLVQWGKTARLFNPDFWIYRLFNAWEDRLIAGNWVITDVRYANEVKEIQSRDGWVIQITRPGFGPANEEEYQSFKKISGLPVIENNGTPEELGAKVLKLIK